MKTLGKLLVAALLLLPFGYEKKENGYSLRAVLYDLNCEETDGKKEYTVSLFGLIAKQVKIVKDLFAKD